MSKLKDNEVVRCVCCSTILKEPLFCKSEACHMSYDVNYNVRCACITCDKCEYCERCSESIHNLRQKLKRARYGKPDESKYECADHIRHLLIFHGIDMSNQSSGLSSSLSE